MKQSLAVGLVLLGLTAGATAQFDGPAPVAWRWVQPTPVSPVGSPVVEDGTVFVAVGQRIYALDKTNGNSRWRFPLGEPIDGYFRSGLTKSGNTLIASADNGNIYAVDAATGELKWTYTSQIRFLGRPVVAGAFVVTALSDNSLMAVNMSDGQAAWSMPHRVFDGIIGQIASHGSNVIVLTGANAMYSLNTANQRADWTARFTTLGVDSQPVIVGETIYVNTGPFLAAVHAGTGRARWQAQNRLGEDFVLAPAVAGGNVLTVTREGRAFIFNESGRQVNAQPIELGSLPATSPSVVGNLLAVPTTNGALNLFNPTTGELVWSYTIRTPVAAGTTGGGGGGGGMPGMEGAGGRGTGGGGGQPAAGQRTTAPVRAAGPAVESGGTLLVLAQDGSLLAFDREYGVDLTPPTVTMLWPTQGMQTSSQPPFELMFRIEDEATGVNENTLKIEIGGTEMKHEFQRDGTAIVRISALGENRPLPNGRQEVVVTVSDWMGNETRAVYAVFIDNTLPRLQRPAGTDPPAGGGGGRGGSGIGR
jgi:outer membrane protein assembly factor BamB